MGMGVAHRDVLAQFVGGSGGMHPQEIFEKWML